MKIVNGLVFINNEGFKKGTLDIVGERIAGFGDSWNTEELGVRDSRNTGELGFRDNGNTGGPGCSFFDTDSIDASGCYVVPGFIDIHFHGCVGQDFSDGSLAGLCDIAAYELRNGITSICPAAMTLPEEKLSQIVSLGKLFRETHSDRKMANFLGFHLEGPFISHEKRGAQNSKYILPPDIVMFRRLLDASHGYLKLTTIAPEMECAMEFIEAFHKEVSISLGHTMADYHTAIEAFHRGANHVTHLFNAMPSLHHRDSGLIGAAFDMAQEKPVYTELICDGIHVSDPVIRSAFALFSDDNIVLISDSMRATGMPNGVYSLGQQEVSVKSRYATLEDGTLAGSVTNLYECFCHAVEAGIPLESALKAVTINPAKSIQVDDNYGSISAGKIADLLILNPDLSIRDIIFHGVRI